MLCRSHQVPHPFDSACLSLQPETRPHAGLRQPSLHMSQDRPITTLSTCSRNRALQPVPFPQSHIVLIGTLQHRF